jgi:hypothetical protein
MVIVASSAMGPKNLFSIPARRGQHARVPRQKPATYCHSLPKCSRRTATTVSTRLSVASWTNASAITHPSLLDACGDTHGSLLGF